MKRAGVRGVAWWHTGAVSYGDDNGNGESMWRASRAREFFCCSSCASLLRKLLSWLWEGCEAWCLLPCRSKVAGAGAGRDALTAFKDPRPA